MTIKKRYVDLLTGTSHAGAGAVTAEARGNIGLGAVYGKVLGFEFKGDDADVDINNTLELKDADGRIILAALALDGGDADSVDDTEQEAVIGTTVSTASTFGVARRIGPTDAKVVSKDGDYAAATEGKVQGMIAKSPVTATILLGTDGDWHRVTLFVEV